MKDMLQSSFTFFKAGQGTFYGGIICSPKSLQSWTIVYDCGTTPRISGNSQSLNAEIDNFKESRNCLCYGNETIDILFISHLDYDHVSGVNRLMNEFKVKRIVIPYFPEDIRKFALLSLPDRKDIHVEDLSEGSFISFVANPYSYLRNFPENPETEIFVINPELNENTEYPGYIESNDSSENNIYARGTQIEANSNSDLHKRDKFYKNNLQFLIQNKWEFTTFCMPIPLIQFKNTKACLNKLLGRRANARITYEEIKKLVGQKRKQTRDCYEKCLSDVNAHGIVLVHGPINFEHLEGNMFSNDDLNIERCMECYEYRNDYHFRETGKRPFLATLLMGDTSLNPQNNIIQFSTEFLKKLPFVHVFQVPHHGSKENWNLINYHNLLLGNNTRHNVFNICSFGYGNKYGHPSHQVLYDLNHSIVLNSQFQSFTVEYDIFYN